MWGKIFGDHSEDEHRKQKLCIKIKVFKIKLVIFCYSRIF